jgi:hypothetical protein
MKKILLTIIFIFINGQIISQNINDALRYSSDNTEGSARFSAMAGAFGALGGELSAVSINPAGSVIFNKGVISLSFSNTNLKNDADLQNNINNNVIQSNISKKSNFNLNQLGAVFIFNNIKKDSKWKKMALSLNYEQTKNNFNKFKTSGINTNGIDTYFLSYADGLRLDEISAFEGESLTQAYAEIGSYFGYANQQAFLGYESFIIEPDDIDNPSNNSYYSNIDNAANSGYYQDYYFKSRGYNGKISANIAFQYTNKLYFGINFNSHFIDYDQSTLLVESNTVGDDIGVYVSDIGFENNLSVLGEGFSLQIGGIAKVNQTLRLGLTYESPTWYTITEETSQSLSTIRSEVEADNTIAINQNLNPNVINVFEDYKIQTPSKITGSGALVFKKVGLLSFDYSIKDYSSIRFKPGNDPHFIEQNSILANTLDQVISYRIGTEILQNRISYRAGYRFEESPKGITNQNLKGYSLGLGYKINNSRIDLSFEKFSLSDTYQMFDAGFLGNINLNKQNSIIKLSVVTLL